MLIKYKQNDYIDEATITIEYKDMDNRLEEIIRTLKQYEVNLRVIKDNQQYVLNLEEVFYFEAVERSTFVYTENDVYIYDKKLYEIEETVENTLFVRISKNCILNISNVVSVKPQLNSKVLATLSNGEKVEVSRRYLNDFKDAFMIGD